MKTSSRIRIHRFARLPRRRAAVIMVLGLFFLMPPDSGYAQSTFASLPDWSGAWQMVGGTVFDRATQVGQGGATSTGVRSRPPYNPEWEAIYERHLALRDQGRFPDTISNC